MDETVLIALSEDDIIELLRDGWLARRGLDIAAYKARVKTQFAYTTRGGKLIASLGLVPVAASETA